MSCLQCTWRRAEISEESDHGSSSLHLHCCDIVNKHRASKNFSVLGEFLGSLYFQWSTKGFGKQDDSSLVCF